MLAFFLTRHMSCLLCASQNAFFLDLWAEVEARLFFVSTIANRTRITVFPLPTNAGGVEGSGAATADSLGESDTFLQQVLQLVAQLPLASQSQQAAEGSTASAALLEKDVVSLFLHAAAARTIGWLSPRVVPERQDLFAPLFALLASRSLQFIASLPVCGCYNSSCGGIATTLPFVVDGARSRVLAANKLVEQLLSFDKINIELFALSTSRQFALKVLAASTHAPTAFIHIRKRK